MCKIRINGVVAGLFLTLALAAPSLAQAAKSQPSEVCQRATEKEPASRLTVRELLTQAEDRAAALRMKLFDIQMQELGLQMRLDDLDHRMTPAALDWALSFVGSARPMDERREALRLRLESEKAGVIKLLDLLTDSRTRLEAAIAEADAEVERLRQRLNP